MRLALVHGLLLACLACGSSSTPAAAVRRELVLFADYHQCHLQDEAARGNLADAWTKDAIKRCLAVADGVVGLATLRNDDVPLVVDIRTQPPPLDLESCDHVAECGLTVRSTKLVVAGCTDDRAKAERLPVAPGHYRVRFHVRGASTLAPDGLSGQDRYEVVLWPASGDEVVVHKQMPGR